MRKILLLFCLFLSFVKGLSQVANQPPDLTGCDVMFDLSVQIPLILGNQDPQEFTVTFHETAADAEIGVNQVGPLYNILNPGQQTIWVRVENEQQQYALTSFLLIQQSIDLPIFPDVTTCGDYVLPNLQNGAAYYSEPGGAGEAIEPGTVISVTTTIYIFAEQNGCSAESSFVVWVLPLPVVDGIMPLYSCVSPPLFFLNEVTTQIQGWNSVPVETTFYHTEFEAQNGTNQILNLVYTSMPQGEVLWVRVTHAGDQGAICATIASFEVLPGDCSGMTPSIIGFARADEQAGCTDSSDGAPSIVVTATSGNDVYYSYTNLNGEYHFYGLTTGTYQVSVNTSWLPSYFEPVGTGSFEVSVVEDVTAVVDFCLTLDEHYDLAVSGYHTVARPGLATSVVLFVSNNGSYQESGTLTYTFDDTLLDYVTTNLPGTVSGNVVSVPVTVNAQQTVMVTISFTVAQPPVADLGMMITGTAQVDFAADENLLNNTLTHVTEIVNSYDPNDIAVAEGPFITEAQADGYLHYTIRFQNMGTADALQVRVENQLSEYLDWNTFTPIAASHSYFTERNNGIIQFHFPDINLVPQSEDEAASQGFVVYKIKPVSTLAEGDVILNQAEIYFDFNAPIFTNEVSTQIQSLGTPDTAVAAMNLYPNPAKGKVSLHANIAFANVTVFDLSGKKLFEQNVNFVSGDATIDVSALATGLYLVRVAADGTSVDRKLMVK